MPPSTTGAVNPHLLSHVRIGDELEVWWPLDRAYYRGKVESRLSDGRYRVAYADGDIEDLLLATEQWRFKGSAAQRVTAALLRVSNGQAAEVDGSDVSSEALGSPAARDSAASKKKTSPKRERK